MSALATGSLPAADAASRTRLLISDDHPLILAGIRRTLERSHDIEIVGEAASAPALLVMVERRRPDLVVLDPRIAGASGLELVQEIHRRWPLLRIVVLSADDDRSAIDATLRAGASACAVKSVRPIDFAALIRRVSSGVFEAAPMQASRELNRTQPASAGRELTRRERTILAAISAGKTTSAISRELWISEHTIKFHLTNIYRKLGVSNRAGAIRHALEHGLVG